MDRTQPAVISGSTTDATAYEVEELRSQVLSLTSENKALKRELSQMKKRAAASTTAAPPAKKFKTAGQKKKLFEKWAKALMRESKKQKITNGGWGPDPYDVKVKDTTPMCDADFHALFDGYGTKVQPTPENKPTSVTTILRFNDYDSIRDFFAAAGGGATIPEAGYEVQLWRRRNFEKSYKVGLRGATLDIMTVNYNRSKQALWFDCVLWSKPYDEC